MNLPSGMKITALREACEQAIAQGQHIMVQAPDLLALLVALDLRERLDADVRLCAVFADAQINSNDPNRFNDYAVSEAARRVLAHDPPPDLSKVPS